MSGMLPWTETFILHDPRRDKLRIAESLNEGRLAVVRRSRLNPAPATNLMLCLFIGPAGVAALGQIDLISAI